jgi:hypothetical protein
MLYFHFVVPRGADVPGDLCLADSFVAAVPAARFCAL